MASVRVKRPSPNPGRNHRSGGASGRPGALGGEAADRMLLIHLLTETASRFIHLPLAEVKTAIEKSMSELAEYLEVDRVYVFDYDFADRTCSNTFEWCAPGIRACIDDLQQCPMSTFPDWLECHLAGQDVYYPDVPGLPEAPFRDILTAQGIKSLVAVPLIGSAGCTGFIGFDSVRTHRTYSALELQLLHLFARMLVSIQERQRADEALAEARQQVENFFEMSIDLLCVVDGEGRFARVSRAWEDLLGLPTEALVGADFIRFVHPDDVGDTMLEFDKLLAGQPSLGFVNRYRAAGGRYRFIEWRSKRISGMVFASARDITDRKDTELALARALEDEREAAAIKANLISVASHEFRTPLASIQLAAEMLRSRVVLPGSEQSDQMLDSILTTTNYLTEVVGDVLDLGAVQRSEPQDGMSEVDLGVWLGEMASLFNDAHGARNPLRLDMVQVGTPRLVTNPSLLRRALNNLLENAAKYSPPHAQVTLRVFQEAEEMVFRVEDEGIGVPPDAEPHLFDLFYRAHNTKFNRGTGLGLPIAKEAVARLDGRVVYRKPSGPGSVFEIRIPHRTTTPH